MVKIKKLMVYILVALLVTTAILYAYGSRDKKLIYSSSLVGVLYESKLLSSKTTLELDVRGLEDTPIAVRLYGVTPEGFIEVAKANGVGGVKVDVTSYISQAENLTRKLGWDPGRAGPSLLAFILAPKPGEKEFINITGMTIAIPIIPGEAKAKNIRVEATYNPVTLARVREGPEGIRIEAPPDRVGEICTYYPGPGGGYECYYWELNQTLYQDTRGVPMLITGLLEPNDASNIAEIYNYIRIDLYTFNIEYISFDIGLAITVGQGAEITLHTPGPGFTIERVGDPQLDNLFRLSCKFYNKILSEMTSECKYMGTKWDVDVGEYSYYAVTATGFRGDLAYSRYNFVHEECMAGFCSREVLNTSHAAWAAPRSSPEGKILPWQHVDDYIYDGDNISELASLIRNNLKASNLQEDQGRYTEISVFDAIINSGSSIRFAVGLPIGALILLLAAQTLPPAALAILPFLVVGIELGVTQISLYTTLGIISVESVVESTYNRTYYEVANYYVVEEEAEYPVPVVLFLPGIT
ncbi:MAG: hypothetical protein GSR85_02105 [Desulfurococcales archaeon]|nr:hypothetical protein [Desulfurococcales archaeon]